MESADQTAGRILFVRRGYRGILHHHDPGTLARYSGSYLGIRRCNVAEPAPGVGRPAAGAEAPAKIQVRVVSLFRLPSSAKPPHRANTSAPCGTATAARSHLPRAAARLP